MMGKKNDLEDTRFVLHWPKKKSCSNILQLKFEVTMVVKMGVCVCVCVFKLSKNLINYLECLLTFAP